MLKTDDAAFPKIPSGVASMAGMDQRPDMEATHLRQKIASLEETLSKARFQIRNLDGQLEKANAQYDRLKCSTQRRLGDLDKRIYAHQQKLRRLRRSADMGHQIVAQFHALASAMADHMYIIDPEGRFTFSNDQVQAFGLSAGIELVGRCLQDVYPHQTCKLFSKKIQEACDNGRMVLFNHAKVVNKVTWHFADVLFPIYIHKELRAIGGISHDISHHKIVEKQLFQAQKMEALGTLVAGVAHEINNPINLILFNLPLLERIWEDLIPMIEKQVGRNPQSKIGGLSYEFIQANLPQLISDMEMAAHRVAKIVSGLKDFSRKGNPAETAMISINQAVENALLLVGAASKKSKSKLTLALANDLPLIRANLQNLEQVVVNLIINAIQSIRHEEGRIHVKTALRPTDDTIIIEVSDNGGGVNPAVADKIFDPFVTDRQADGGTGLGLSVTYNLIKALGGAIDFTTVQGEGTTFTVVLPAEIRRKRFKVMVVDDDRMFRDLLNDVLSKQADSVVEGFDNGAEALIRLGSDPPDLLILDMFMPEIDGLGVCRAIKNELDLEMTKVIIVTGFPDHPNLHEAARMGFVQIFTKPLDIDTFIVKVREILHGRSS